MANRETSGRAGDLRMRTGLVASTMLPATPRAGDEAFSVEHGSHDTPCHPVDEEEGAGESEGEAERGADDVEIYQ